MYAIVYYFESYGNRQILPYLLIWYFGLSYDAFIPAILSNHASQIKDVIMVWGSVGYLDFDWLVVRVNFRPFFLWIGSLVLIASETCLFHPMRQNMVEQQEIWNILVSFPFLVVMAILTMSVKTVFFPE